MDPKPEEIAKLAYKFYIEDGKPVGCAKEHWLRAEEFLRHPENHADSNVLSVPSEPEITRALDEKARDLDQGLPSDPRSGKEAVHQWVEIASGPREERRDAAAIQEVLKHLPGVERVKVDPESGRVRIHFDARRTNPAAIHEAILEHDFDSPEVSRR
jgi:copper chaperone CopZ